MKKILIISATAIVFCAASVGLFFTVNGDKQPPVNPQASTVVKGAKTINGQLIDVRTPEEFAASHAQDAINIPLASIQAGDFSKIDKGKSLYLYCRTGNRAGQAKIILEKAGYKNITNIGGLLDWQKQGGAVVSG